MKAYFAVVLALFAVFALTYAQGPAPPQPRETLKGAEQFYYASPYVYSSYAAVPYAAYPSVYYYR